MANTFAVALANKREVTCSPTRSKIKKGKVVSLKGLFDKKGKVKDNAEITDLKWLKKPILKPSTPMSTVVMLSRIKDKNLSNVTIGSKKSKGQRESWS